MLLVVLGWRNAAIPRSKHLMVCRLILQPLEVLCILRCIACFKSR
jgi:hypothetical protein